MYFEQCERPQRRFRKTDEIIAIISEFLSSGIECAELKQWDDEYKDVKTAYTGLRKIANDNFREKVYVGKAGDRIFLERIEK